MIGEASTHSQALSNTLIECTHLSYLSKRLKAWSSQYLLGFVIKLATISLQKSIMKVNNVSTK